MINEMKVRDRQRTMNLAVSKDGNDWQINDTLTSRHVGTVTVTPKGHRIKIHQIKDTYEVYSWLYMRRMFGVTQYLIQAY